MEQNYGDDFITITDEDGIEYELEVLTTLEYRGSMYLALIPAAEDDGAEDVEVSILKSVCEDGEDILCTIEDEKELEAVYELMMDQLYDETDE